MKQKTALSCLLFIAIIPLSSARDSITLETDQLNAISSYICPKDKHAHTAIICDLDNTLIMPDSCEEYDGFGTDQWFCALSQYLIAHNLARNDDDTDLLLMPIVFKFWEQNGYRLVEEYAAELLHSLRSHGITVLGLTARHPLGAQYTHQHLRSLNICFHHKHDYDDIDLSDRYPALYLNGVLFCDLNEKPDVLARYFNTVSYWPTKIIFIDDKLKNVLKMEAFCKKHNIEFIGIRYSKLDAQVRQFKLENTFTHLVNFFQQNSDIPPIAGLMQLLPHP